MRANYVFDMPDGTQVLITVWESGNATAATRAHPQYSWGPPIAASLTEFPVSASD